MVCDDLTSFDATSSESETVSSVVKSGRYAPGYVYFSLFEMADQEGGPAGVCWWVGGLAIAKLFATEGPKLHTRNNGARAGFLHQLRDGGQVDGADRAHRPEVVIVPSRRGSIAPPLGCPRLAASIHRTSGRGIPSSGLGDLVEGDGHGNFFWIRPAAAGLPPSRGCESGSRFVYYSDDIFIESSSNSRFVLPHAEDGWRLQPMKIRFGVGDNITARSNKRFRDGELLLGLRVALKRPMSMSSPRRHHTDRAAFVRPTSFREYNMSRSWSSSQGPNTLHNMDDAWNVPPQPQPQLQPLPRKIDIPPASNASMSSRNTINEMVLSMKFDPIQYAKANKLVETFKVLGGTGEFSKLREPTKHLYDSLLQLVESYHDNDLCFSQISESTVLITSDWKFVLIEGTFALVNWTIEGANMNYRDIASLFRKLIHVSVGWRIVLEDFEMLLHAMECNGSMNRPVINQHASLLPICNTSAAYMSMYELLRKILPAKGRAGVMCRTSRSGNLRSTKMRLLPYRRTWVLRMVCNDFMLEFLKRTYKHGQLSASGLVTNRIDRNFQDTDLEFLDIIRHLFCHRMDMFPLCFNYIPIHVDLMCYALFTKLLAKLQQIVFSMSEWSMNDGGAEWELKCLRYEISGAEGNLIKLNSEAMRTKGSSEVANLTAAEQYMEAFANLAKMNGSILLPSDAGNPSVLIIAQSMQIYNNICLTKSLKSGRFSLADAPEETEPDEEDVDSTGLPSLSSGMPTPHNSEDQNDKTSLQRHHRDIP
uniref:STML2-like C-terminal extension domain-containing protein n=1 Tax=Leersia perrieri TaxID=77586 RepID=A0A0D9WAC0_9ORYZ